MRIVFIGMVLSVLLGLAGQAQPCNQRPIIITKGPDGTFGATNRAGQVIAPFRYRYAGLLAEDLLEVDLTGEGLERGVLDQWGKLIVPIAYQGLREAGPDCIEATRGDEHFLYSRRGELLYQARGELVFMGWARLQRLLVLTRAEPRGYGESVQLIDLKTKQVLYGQKPCQNAGFLYYDVRNEPGCLVHGWLPFIELRRPDPAAPDDRSRTVGMVLNPDGRVLYDSLDESINLYHAVRGTLQLRRRERPVIITDTLLRAIPWLSYRYSGAWPTGPGQRWWYVRQGPRAGVLDATGGVIWPVDNEGELGYVGAGSFLLTTRHEVDDREETTQTLLTADHRRLILAGYYLLDRADTTLARRPLLIGDRQTHKLGLLDPQLGLVVPPRYDQLARAGDDDLTFFRGDSAGYLSSRGRVRLALPGYVQLAPYREGRAVGGRVVPGATREQYPGAQFIRPGGGPPQVVRYDLLDERGRRLAGDFDYVGSFQDGYVAVQQGAELAMLNAKGKPATFHGAALVSYFNAQGLAVVKQNGLYGLVTKTGRLVLPIEYKDIDQTHGSHSQLLARPEYTGLLLPINAPRVASGQLTVTTAAGERRQVPAPAGE